MARNYGRLKIFASKAGGPLGVKICSALSIPLGKAHIGRFKDGEVDDRLLENIRDDDVYIIAPTNMPYENLIEAQHICFAAKFSSAARVTLVIPYQCGARGDRKCASRMPIPIRLALRTLEIAKPDRFIILDIHAEQSLTIIEDAICDHLFGSAVLVPHLKRVLDGRKFVVAAPDQGGAGRAAKYAEFFGHDDFVSVNKLRTAPGVVKKDSIKIGANVKGKLVLVVDDMIDGGGTIIAVSEKLKAAGATEVWVAATHALFSGQALDLIEKSIIDRVFVTDSIWHNPDAIAAKTKKVEIISCASLLAQAIRRTHEGESLSELIL